MGAMVTLTFDVESRGLRGEGFAFGYVMTDSSGRAISSGIHSCPHDQARHDPAASPEEQQKTDDWLFENVLFHLPPPDCATPTEVRQRFAYAVRGIAGVVAMTLAPGAGIDGDIRQGSLGRHIAFVVDCGYPVETRFLADARDEHPPLYQPYPLFDLSTLLLAKGLDPTGDYFRLKETELPAHNPLNDARQTARIWHSLLMYGEIR